MTLRAALGGSTVRWLAPLAVAFLLLWLPAPAGVTPHGHALLVIFSGLIVALATSPVPMGAAAFIALSVALFTSTLSADQAFAAFGAPVLWLILAALVLARGLSETGLSRRIAYNCVRACGTSPLRLAYALALADLMLAPFIPSDTARAGGIVYPVARSLAEANDSHPEPTAGRLGRFLTLSVYNVGVTTAAMFVTSMSANPLLVELAGSSAGVTITWTDWALAAIVPGAVSLTMIPWVVYRLEPPTMVSTLDAPQWAREQLAAMGSVTRAEKWLALILVLLVAGWMTQPLHGLHPAVIALGGVSLALLLGVIRWDHVIDERGAWDAVVWFGIVLMLAKALNDAGVMAALAGPLAQMFRVEWWVAAVAILLPLYVLIHYLYASMTAQIVTLYPVFVALALASGTPPLVAALAFAFFSSINACVTHYGSGSGPVVFGGGYVSQLRWWRTGLVLAGLHLAIWIGIGLPWWRAIGFY